MADSHCTLHFSLSEISSSSCPDLLIVRLACCCVRLFLLALSYAISSAMYDPFSFEDIEFSPCFSSAISFFNVEEHRVVSDFNEVPALDFDDILRYPGEDDDYGEEMGEKRRKGDEGERIGLGLSLDGVSQTHACSRRKNEEKIVAALPKEGEENMVEGTKPSSQSGRNPRWISLASPTHSKATAGRAPKGGRKVAQGNPSSTAILSTVQPRTEWYARPYTTRTQPDGYMCPPRGGVPPQLAGEIARDGVIQSESRKRKSGEDGCKAGKRMRAS
ncbi:hypothetical protein EDD15DRAFT_2311931, partial [Pisolithus albus]